MAEPLLYLTYLGVIFITGIILSMLSVKLKIPNVLLLLAFGIFLNYLGKIGLLEITFPPVFIASMGLLALVMIVFDSSSRFKIREFDEFSMKTLKVTFIFLALNLIFLTIFTRYMFGIQNIFLALIFSALMSGTSPSGVFSFMKQSKNAVVEFLQIESITNTPLIVLLPFLFLELIGGNGGQDFITTLVSQLGPFLEQVISGIGSGIIVGLIFFKVMRRYYSAALSPIATVTAALITYVLAENLGGNGVLAVTTLGLFFGNIFIKQKEELQKFSFMFTNLLEVFVFIIIGLIIDISFTQEFFIKSLALFGLFLLIRFVALNLSFFRKEYHMKEKIFMTLSIPKGIAVAVVAIALSTVLIPQMNTILDLVLAFFIYSIIISTIIAKFSKFFIRTQLVKG
ncbi:cation:proton antiporter [Candidatus Woesearchaeota archaeon]|nr:cation:proton antiporter [Candidatus Woesearchaeota archaeon]